jgi:hypothetical protein
MPACREAVQEYSLRFQPRDKINKPSLKVPKGCRMTPQNHVACAAPRLTTHFVNPLPGVQTPGCIPALLRSYLTYTPSGFPMRHPWHITVVRLTLVATILSLVAFTYVAGYCVGYRHAWHDPDFFPDTVDSIPSSSPQPTAY